jgi:hypothetical protein
MTIKITDHLFQYGSDKFFRGSAYKMELGTFGEKKDPIGPKAYLAVEGKIRASHLAERPIHQGKPMEIDWSSVQKAALEANGTLKFFGIGVNGGTSFDYEYAKKAKLKLINYWINEGPMKACLNNDADTVRLAMFDEGNDARVVNEIVIAVTAELAEELDRNFSSSADVTFAGNELSLSVAVGSSSSTTITLGEGTCFAYRMYKVKKWDRKNKLIEDLEDDNKGMG